MFRFTKALSAILIGLFFTAGLAHGTSEESDTLSNWQRAVVPIAAFTATGNLSELETALNEGLEAGLTVNEIKEILVHSYAYAGFPRALNGINTFIAVMEERREQGIEDKTGKEAAPVPADFDANAYGHKVRNGLVGRDISNRTSGYAAFTPVIDEFLVEHLFADIFYRDVLNHQQRELVTISILSAMTGTKPQLKGHLRISMTEGFTEAQLREFISVLRDEVGGGSAERAAEALNEQLEE